VPPILNPLKRLFAWRFRTSNSEKLYGAIVAQARLPEFYRKLGIPDSLEGRFGLLALNLFAVLHALAAKGPGGRELAQGLVDRFSKDMETVLRELGVGDLAIPKKVRELARSSRGFLNRYEAAFSRGDGALAEAIEASMPTGSSSTSLSSGPLASYVRESVERIGRQPLADLEAGSVHFARTPEGS
jgi:cytochrome b pre-mRNA-processing protein 3